MHVAGSSDEFLLQGSSKEGGWWMLQVSKGRLEHSKFIPVSRRWCYAGIFTVEKNWAVGRLSPRLCRTEPSPRPAGHSGGCMTQDICKIFCGKARHMPFRGQKIRASIGGNLTRSRKPRRSLRISHTRHGAGFPPARSKASFTKNASPSDSRAVAKAHVGRATRLGWQASLEL